jgi:hypothetical protein
MSKTSISDYDAYKNICLQASVDDNIFATFKQNAEYTVILEHTSKEQGQEYLNYVLGKKNLSLDDKTIEVFKGNDLYGSPHVVDYGNGWVLSPSTLRYVKVLSELTALYGSLDGFKIAEIGIGYGGQCKVINDYYDIKSYTLIDLPEVLGLGKKYLSSSPYAPVEFKTMNQLYTDDYDLVISNYAITECNKDVQEEYICKVLRGSTHGYITCNFISDYFNIQSLTREEFIKMLDKKVNIIAEVPLTHPRNFILSW